MSILSRDPNLSTKPPQTQGKRIRLLERTMVDKNGESSRNLASLIQVCWRGWSIPLGFLDVCWELSKLGSFLGGFFW